ncbi:long-chain-acyl-CoA synthetase [Actinocatenispora rupis]|uniref:Long-chain-acyl-CoA synthetase n=1 Tax=Actinocatenispora rupis TaxID=519421 RepID=A0A8J3JFQ1_9ACTN|nr:long-chain-acyl-CoA synthetase [Actinocatenispora rupis]GID15582.1 long-chain-acyl-CoA synthetase [Actinocatenispora rupis]
MTGPVARTFSVLDLLRAVPGTLGDLGTITRGAVGTLTLTADSRASIGLVFQRIAARHPDRAFLTFEGTTLSYGTANAHVNRYAAVLADRGVGPGDVVGVLATNRPGTLLVALAAVKLGAIAGLLNHHQRGAVLDHGRRVLGARVVVVGTECVETWESSTPDDTDVVCLPVDGAVADGMDDLDRLAAGADDRDPPGCARLRAGTTAFHVFTSGTTGLPKASAMSHLRWLKGMNFLGRVGARLTPDDTLHCCLPLYHNNALTVSLSAVLAAGATLSLSRTFSASRFWDEVIAADATAFIYIGELCRYLVNQPPRDTDRRHRVRVALGNGLRPEIWPEFTARFGIRRVAEFYAASEGNMAFINVFNLDRTAGFLPLPFAVVAYDPATGLPSRGPDGRLRRVRTGESGLLLTKVTTRFPFDGYTDKGATDAKLVLGAFRTGDAWFNTGDLVRRQGFRHIAFADRLGDTYRWKGENVATAEVEGVLAEHPDVAQAVVYGVAVPGADGRAGMAAVRLRPGAAFDGPGLARHVLDRLPRYAAPLFVRVVDEVAQTSTFKAHKAKLRDEGYDPDRVPDPVHVLTADGYVPAYVGYADDVATGAVRT